MNNLPYEYWLEKGFEVIENDYGFVVLAFHENSCLVQDFYVRPSFRGTKIAFKLINEAVKLAKEKGCMLFCAEVYKSDPAYHYNVRLQRHFGMSIIEDTPYKTVTAKQLELVYA